MSKNIFQHTLPNGMVLLAEHMPHVRSAAFNVLVRAGCAYDPPGARSLASVLAELITRGAGNLSSRELSLALDNLGLDRSESVGQIHMRFWGVTLARNLPAGLELYADILRRPHLPEEDLPPVQALALQELQSLEDEPRSKVMVELRRRYWPAPLGQDRRGSAREIENLTIAKIRKFYQTTFGPRGSIISIAGNIDWPSLRDQVERLFGDWPSPPEKPIQFKEPLGGQSHIKKDTTQTQIAVAYPSVPFGHPEYYAANGAVQVLSAGGMSSRLFTEVREKRGLCYGVSASYQTFKEHACVLVHAAATSERAQETLDVTVQELHRLKEGISADEVQRVQAGLKSGLIMQQESTSARAGALANDWYFLQRVRSKEEIQAAIDSLTPQMIVKHVKGHPPRDFTVVTLGPKKLQVA